MYAYGRTPFVEFTIPQLGMFTIWGLTVGAYQALDLARTYVLLRRIATFPGAIFRYSVLGTLLTVCELMVPRWAVSVSRLLLLYGLTCNVSYQVKSLFNANH